MQVEFDANGGLPVPNTQNVEVGQRAGEPAQPTKDNHNFVGWFKGSTKWEFTNTVTEALRLIAKWEEIQTQQPPTQNNGNSQSGENSFTNSERSSVRPDRELQRKEENNIVTEIKNPIKNAKSENIKSSEIKTILSIGKKEYKVITDTISETKIMDVVPIVNKGRVLIPARQIGEFLGIDVNYNQKSKTAVFKYNSNEVALTLGKNFMLIDGEKVSLTTNIMFLDGRIMLPLKDIQSAFYKLGVNTVISWDNHTKTITIIK